MADSLLSHLATKFAAHEENWATEALGYILRRSPVARDTVRDLVGKLGVALPASLVYANQVSGDDDARPDLVGRDDQGTQRLLIEAKFWAGLTEHQPVTYLGRLSPGQGGLLFVVPAARITLVWHELIQRCRKAGLAVSEEPSSLSETRTGRLEDARRMAILSWRTLLDPIARDLETAGDRSTREDVTQLGALCDRMDATAFLPVTSEELTTQVFRRVVQFGEVVDAVANVLTTKGVASTNGGRLRSTGGNGWYGRFLLLNKVLVFLICDVRKWTKYASTPLWLSVYGTNYANFRMSNATAARQALGSLETEDPPRMFMANDGFPTVALRVPLGQERDAVIACVVDQILEVASKIEPLAADAKPGPVEMPSETADP